LPFWFAMLIAEIVDALRARIGSVETCAFRTTT
jgi:hypothetical protein